MVHMYKKQFNFFAKSFKIIQMRMLKNKLVNAYQTLLAPLKSPTNQQLFKWQDYLWEL